MTITREIDGKTVEIELTGEEMLNAYYRKQIEWDREDMEMYLVDGYEDCPEIFKDQYGKEYADAIATLDELGLLLRKYIEEYSVSWENARDEAIQHWAREADRKPMEYVGGGDREETAE